LTWIREHRLNPDEDPIRFHQAMERANIPRRFWDADPEQVKGDNTWIKQSLADPANVWAGRGYGLFIHGPFNTGKSAAAAILARDFVMRCHVVLWLSVRDVPAVRFHEGDMAKLDKLLRRADLLVLDDLGSERYRLESAAGAALEEVVRIMYEANRAPIITSNVEWQAFQAGYPKSFVSLVTRMCIPVSLVDPWDDKPNLGMAR